MSYRQGKYPILRKDNLAKNIYSLTLLCPEIAAETQAGQFAHLRIEGFALRRPISICEANPDAGTIRLVFEVRGEGTAELARLNENSLADLIAPLGKGFTLLDPPQKAVLIGGGIGVPPLLQAAKHYGANATAILGFRSASAVILTEDFAAAGADVRLCTDDGSMGQKGFVTTALEERLQMGKADLLCACGPAGMLRGVIALAEQYGLRCEVSLEERMGCGVGACLVCACRSVKDGREFYAHVCKDGPVFDAKEVVL